MVFIFNFNCNSRKCSVILQNLPSELPLNLPGFMNNYPACRPAVCKKFLQPQLGWRSFRILPDLILFCINNQSRICGKGVGLGLFPSDSLKSQSFEFIEVAHIGPYYGVKNVCRIFRSNRMDSFCENRKKSKIGCFWPFLG